MSERNCRKANICSCEIRLFFQYAAGGWADGAADKIRLAPNDY